MGHSWREMDPAGATAHDRRIDRILRLRNELKDVPLGEFAIGALDAVLRLFGLAYGCTGTLEPHEEHLQLLEERVRSRKSTD